MAVARRRGRQPAAVVGYRVAHDAVDPQLLGGNVEGVGDGEDAHPGAAGLGGSFAGKLLGIDADPPSKATSGHHTAGEFDKQASKQ